MRQSGVAATIAPGREVGALAALLPPGIKVAALAPADAVIASLHPLEALLTAGESAEQNRQFAAGRHCAQQLLATLGGERAPLLRRHDGAPDWPSSIRGSISHKAALCLAIGGDARLLAGIGVDLEPRRALPAPVWARVFTAAELRRLNVMPPAARAIRARLCFSAKECYYKWYRSQHGRWQPDFHDVEVEIAGTVIRIRPTLGSRFPEADGCFVQGDNWLITALWSYPAIPVHNFSAHPQHNSLEVDHHGYTHRSPVHP